MIELTCGNTETSEEVVDDGPDGSLQLQWHPQGLNTTIDGNADDEEDVQPVDVLVPVGTGHLGVSDVHLLGVRRTRAGSLCLGRHDCMCVVCIDQH